MPSRPSDITPRVDARIRELSAQGLSLRKVETALEAEGVFVSYRRVGEVLKATPKPQPRPYVAPEVEELEVPPDAPIDVVKARFLQVSRIASQIGSAIETGEIDAKDAPKFAGLAKLEADLAARIVALTPPVPPDPAHDPANLQARGVVMAHVLQSIEAVERRAGRGPR